MENKKYNSGLDAVYLISCAVNQMVPEKNAVESIDYETLPKMLKYHSLQAMAYVAFKAYRDANGELPSSMPEQLYASLENGYKKTVRATIGYAMEREKIFSYFDAQGIWYLPLKGIILQDLYPTIGMRQMADNDILFDSTYRKAVKEYMIQNGFSVFSYGKGAHDIYQKAPFFNFELHIQLYMESVNDVFSGYYNNVKDRLIKVDADRCCYRFSDEDFYIHMLTHIYKHYSCGGIGIRFLSDLYVFLMNKGDTLDLVYLDSELEKLGLCDFEVKLRSLSNKIFDPACPLLRDNSQYLTEAESSELAFFIDSGVHGTKEQEIKSNLEQISGDKNVGRKDKLKYVLRRVFPGKLYYKENYPFLYKYKVFIPFFVIYRLFKGLVFKGKQTRGEFRNLNK